MDVIERLRERQYYNERRYCTDEQYINNEQATSHFGQVRRQLELILQFNFGHYETMIPRQNLKANARTIVPPIQTSETYIYAWV